MSFEPEELVDSFGRTIQPQKKYEGRRDFKKGYGSRDDQDHRSLPVQRNDGYRRDIRNFKRHSNDNYPPSSHPPPIQGYPPHRQDKEFYPPPPHHQEVEWGSDYRSNYQPKRSDYDSNRNNRDFPPYHSDHGVPPPPPIVPIYRNPSVLPVHQHIRPLMSFKNFMLSQTDDVSPEQFQSRYDDYCIQYLYDFSDTFFHVSKSELWFQDRYNPLRIKEFEMESAQWSYSESNRIRESLENHTALVIQKMCLNRLEPSDIRQHDNNREKQGFQNFDLLSTTQQNNKDDDGVNDIPGKHYSGHEHRAIFVTGIHSSCSLQILKHAIQLVLSDPFFTGPNNSILTPERVVLSQPMWTKSVPSRFERKAWIIMPNMSSVKLVLDRFSEIDIPMPGSVDPMTGESPILFTFKVTLSRHFVRQSHILPDRLSTPHRIAVDTYKARELAELLDKDKNIPEKNRLSTILKLPIVENECIKPTDKLDIAIAYLRRVHFVVFYGGKLYFDEAHLLTMSPGCSFRKFPPSSSINTDWNNLKQDQSNWGNFSSENRENNEQENELDKRDDDNEKQEENVPDDEQEDSTYRRIKYDQNISYGSENKNEEMQSGSHHNDIRTNDNNDNGPSSTTVIDVEQNDLISGNDIKSKSENPDEPSDYIKRGYSDRNVEAMIKDLSRKLERKKMIAEGDLSLLTKDEEDANTLERLNDESMTEYVKVNCKIEKEGKTRCWFPYCNKLFKGLDFLKKHVVLKHDSFMNDIFLRNAEPYMRIRYENDDIIRRPLPPVEIEALGGIEKCSVREILDKHTPKILLPPVLTSIIPHFSTSHNYRDGPTGQRDYRSDNRRRHTFHDRGDDAGNNSLRGSVRGRDDRDKRYSLPYDFDNNPSSSNKTIEDSTGVTATDDLPKRKLSTYMDVDAPKETVAAIDYGVAILPPVKKKKLIKK